MRRAASRECREEVLRNEPRACKAETVGDQSARADALLADGSL
jgi:hypothetical protein